MKNQKIKKTVRYKLFISFLLTIIIPIVFFIALIISYIIMQDNKKLNEELIYISNKISQKFDNEFKQIDEYILGLSVTNSMEKLMYSQAELIDYKRYDPTNISNYNQQLSVSAILNPFILYMDVFLNEKNIVFSRGRNLSALNTYLEVNFDLTKSEYTDLRKIIGEYTDGIIIYPVKFQGNQSDSMLYIKTIPGKGDSIIRGTTLFILDTEYVESTLNQILSNEMKAFMVYNNKLIIGDANLWYEMNKQQNDMPDIIDYNIYNLRIDSRKYRIIRNTNRNGIESYIVFDNKKRLNQVSCIILGSFLLLIILIICAYTFARFITKKNYQSLKYLINIIDHPDELDDDVIEMENEYSSIYKSYKNILSLSKKQHETIDQQYADILEYCLRVLLERNHEIDEGVLDKIDEITPIKLYERHLCAVLINGNHNKVANNLATIINFKEKYICHVVCYVDYTCLIINIVDEEYMEKIFIFIKDFMINCDIPETICCIGYTYQNINEINKSYNEAILISNFYNSNDDKRVLFRRDYEYFMSNFYYTINQEIQLSNLLRNGDYDGAINIVSEILNVNMSIYTISPRAIRNFFFAIYLTGIRVSSEMEYDVKQHRGPSEILKLHNIEEISAVVYSYFKDLCSTVQGESNLHQDFSKGELELFIKNNITNPDLSMQMVSEHICKSISYTSRLFNKVYNMPFIQYVNRRRVDIAAKILKDSNKNIKEVSERVGFSSEITFRRSFQRYKGVTPSKYRNKI